MAPARSQRSRNIITRLPERRAITSTVASPLVKPTRRIAAQAMTRNLTLVTNHKAHFGRVQGLKTVTWQRG